MTSEPWPEITPKGDDPEAKFVPIFVKGCVIWLYWSIWKPARLLSLTDSICHCCFCEPHVGDAGKRGSTDCLPLSWLLIQGVRASINAQTLCFPHHDLELITFGFESGLCNPQLFAMLTLLPSACNPMQRSNTAEIPFTRTPDPIHEISYARRRAMESELRPDGLCTEQNSEWWNGLSIPMVNTSTHLGPRWKDEQPAG